MKTPREGCARARRIVVKIGSRALANDGERSAAIARAVARHRERRFVLVSSGAIALGARRLGYRTRPREMARLQAAAAAGQSLLMHRWDAAFLEHGLAVAQVLLTHADLADRHRLNNAREALAALLEAGAVPVVNENDTVATEEIRFGDNDQLAAMVAPLVGADLLVLLTDVEGVLDATGRRIPLLAEDSSIGVVAPPKEAWGSGGMASKLDAARKASRSGAHVVIAPAAAPDVLDEVLRGGDVGTLVPANSSALRARQHWIAYTLRPRGTVLVDDGAARALRGGKSSLLPVGVLGVRGHFDRGDAVRLARVDGVELGRGLTRLGALDLARAAGCRREQLDELFGPGGRDLVVVHRDDLVLA